MKKKDLSTRDLSVYLKTTVEEVRKIQADPGVQTSIADRTTETNSHTEDSSATYCRTRTDGLQHSIEFENRRYCTLQKICICQRQNGKPAKECAYKRR